MYKVFKGFKEYNRTSKKILVDNFFVLYGLL